MDFLLYNVCFLTLFFLKVHDMQVKDSKINDKMGYEKPSRKYQGCLMFE